jgi:hypothetical protein
MTFMAAVPAIEPPLAESNSNQTQLRPGAIVIARRGEPGAVRNRNTAIYTVSGRSCRLLRCCGPRGP